MIFSIMCIFLRMCEDLIKKALHNMNVNNECSGRSVLKELSEIDPKVAIVMTLDMLLAGVDTVFINFLIFYMQYHSVD